MVELPTRLPLAPAVCDSCSAVPWLLPIKLDNTTRSAAILPGAVKSGLVVAVLPAMIEFSILSDSPYPTAKNWNPPPLAAELSVMVLLKMRRWSRLA